MPAPPEQHFVIDHPLDPGHHPPRPEKGSQRQECGDRTEEGAKSQRLGKKASWPGGEQGAQHGQAHADAEDPEGGKKQRLLEHRDVVVEHRIGARKEWRDGHQRRPQRRQAETTPAKPRQSRTADRRPDHRGKGHEPDCDRQVDVHHQRRTEHILERKDVLNAGRARQDQQHGEQTGTDQRHHPQPQPGTRQSGRCSRSNRRRPRLAGRCCH
jgi:hypothetical protein